MREDEHLLLGRILMDQGFRDLFCHDPDRAAAHLGVTLPPESLDRIAGYLSKMEAMDPSARGRFTARLNALERWKQE